MNKALIVGINDYAPIGSGGPDLRGCVNDAKDIANTLNILGVVPSIPSQMRLLLDKNATRDNILGGIEWLVKGAKSDEVRVLYYSGHGTQVIDGWPTDEPEGRDEAICPHDFQTAGVITDDQIAAAIKAVPTGVRLEVIFDSCHSGSATRALDDDIRIRYVHPPAEQAFFLEQFASLPLRSALRMTTTTRNIATASINHVMWAGCKDGQLSQEMPIDGTQRGVFTYWFCKVLRKAGVTGIRRVIDSQVALNVKRTVSNQTPQLEGQKAAMKKPIFGATREPEKVTAAGRSGGSGS